MAWPLGLQWIKALQAKFDSAGKLLTEMLPSIIRSGGSTTTTGFQIADGTDLATLFGGVDNVTVTTSGTGFVNNITTTKSGKNITLTQNKGAVAFCTYCTYCALTATQSGAPGANQVLLDVSISASGNNVHLAKYFVANFCTYCSYCDGGCMCA